MNKFKEPMKPHQRPSGLLRPICQISICPMLFPVLSHWGSPFHGRIFQHFLRRVVAWKSKCVQNLRNSFWSNPCPRGQNTRAAGPPDQHQFCHSKPGNRPTFWQIHRNCRTGPVLRWKYRIIIVWMNELLHK